MIKFKEGDLVFVLPVRNTHVRKLLKSGHSTSGSCGIITTTRSVLRYPWDTDGGDPLQICSVLTKEGVEEHYETNLLKFDLKKMLILSQSYFG